MAFHLFSPCCPHINDGEGRDSSHQLCPQLQPYISLSLGKCPNKQSSRNQTETKMKARHLRNLCTAAIKAPDSFSEKSHLNKHYNQHQPGKSNHNQISNEVGDRFHHRSSGLILGAAARSSPAWLVWLCSPSGCLGHPVNIC